MPILRNIPAWSEKLDRFPCCLGKSEETALRPCFLEVEDLINKPLLKISVGFRFYLSELNRSYNALQLSNMQMEYVILFGHMKAHRCRNQKRS